MKIKKWNQFLEAVGGFEVPLRQIGPNYGEQKLAVTLSQSDTQTLLGMDGNFYTYDDFQTLYNDYLKSGGEVLQGGFTKGNLDLILSFFGE